MTLQLRSPLVVLPSLSRVESGRVQIWAVRPGRPGRPGSLWSGRIAQVAPALREVRRADRRTFGWIVDQRWQGAPCAKIPCSSGPGQWTNGGSQCQLLIMDDGPTPPQVTGQLVRNADGLVAATTASQKQQPERATVPCDASPVCPQVDIAVPGTRLDYHGHLSPLTLWWVCARHLAFYPSPSYYALRGCESRRSRSWSPSKGDGYGDGNRGPCSSAHPFDFFPTSTRLLSTRPPKTVTGLQSISNRPPRPCEGRDTYPIRRWI